LSSLEWLMKTRIPFDPSRRCCRAALGLLGRRAFHQARGLRTAARGVGMLMAGFGITYVEYRRRAE